MSLPNLPGLSNLGDSAGAVGNIANRLQSLMKDKDKLSPAKIRNLNTNGFLGPDNLFIPSFFVRAFDEPTYLTFRIEFITDPNETIYRNIAYNNNGLLRDESMKLAMYNTMYDYMPEPFLEDFGVIAVKNTDGSTTKDSSAGKTYSTEAYLDLQLGDHGRAAMLHNFKAALKDIEENFPYYFKSISGLSSLAKINPTNGARLKDAAITIECEEGIDLKIMQLNNAYRKIVWDDVYQRWVLPDMMRFFGMRIYVSEIRLFHNMTKQSSTRNTNVDIFGNNRTDLSYDFSHADVRNAYSLPLSKESEWEKANNALKTGTAISNSFLGTKNSLTKALNNVSGMVTETFDTLSGIDNIFNDVMLVNNVINDVMPTICFECHMCEFDISDTMNPIDRLANNNKESKKLNPTIKIKIGQVKETQVYPLNIFLENENGHYVLKNNNGKIGTFGDAETLKNLREWTLGYTGQYFSDNLLNKRYSTDKLSDRVKEYNDNLSKEFFLGNERPNMVSRRRLGKYLNCDLDDMSYSKEGSPESLAQASLGAALLNQTSDTINTIDAVAGKMMDSAKKSISKALENDSKFANAVKAIGSILQDAADKIYNGAEIKSLALSDVMRANLSNNLFDKFISDLEKNAKEDSALKKILKSYRDIQTAAISTATNGKISGWSYING